jgi:hypothetical protein
VTLRDDAYIDHPPITELQRKETGNELTDETDHQIRSLICSLPARRMDSPYSARFRLVDRGEIPATLAPEGCR